MKGLLAVLTSMLVSFTPAGGSEAPVHTWLEAEQADRILHVIPYAQSRETLTLRYELTSVKSGRAGHSSSRQAGEAVVTCCAPQVLTHLRFTFGSGDRYTIILRVFRDQVLIGEEQLAYPCEALQPQLNQAPTRQGAIRDRRKGVSISCRASQQFPFRVMGTGIVSGMHEGQVKQPAQRSRLDSHSRLPKNGAGT